MLDFLKKLFDSDFMPHGHCYFWRPEIVWLHVSSDSLIAMSYYMIPFSLVYLVRKRKDLAFNWMFVMFGVFILACGTTHLMNIWTLWHGTYRLDGVIKALTALASFPTAMLLFRLVPKALTLPSPEELSREIAERRLAEEKVRTLNAELERRVEERTRRLERSNEALRKFAYIASHDLQEPIRMVSTYNQLLEKRYKGKLDQDADDYIRFAVEGSARMSRLVADLLDYARTLDEINLAPSEAVNANQVLQDTLADLRMVIESTAAEVESSELPSIHIAETHLKQLFQNLISNALKYRKPGVPPVIGISASRQSGRWLFAIRDNGIGFDMKYHDQIFHAFKRLHGREVPGSGVGLAICQNVISFYGGSIWAESKPDAGSTFYFSVPAEPVAAKSAVTV